MSLIKGFSRFVLVSAAATALHFLCLFILVEPFGISAHIANAAAFLVAFGFNYETQRRITFAIRKPFAPQLGVALLGNFLLNQALFSALLIATGWYYLICLAVTVALTAPLTFLIANRSAGRLQTGN